VAGLSGSIHYARSGDGVHIAYEVTGDRTVDLVFVPPGVTHLEHLWEHPGYERAFRRLTKFCRLITVNKRGSGLSDRTVDMPTAEQQVEDVTAVFAAAGVERAFLLGALDGGQSCLLFAASHPEMVAGVIAWATNARGTLRPTTRSGARPRRQRSCCATRRMTSPGPRPSPRSAQSPTTHRS